MRVLVTGANGMLATNLVEQLLHDGYSVRGILRSTSRYRGILHPRLELMEGDFTDCEAASQAVAGCDLVIHSAAIIAQNLTRYEEYKRVNVDATEQLLRLSASTGVKRFVYVSSANTVGSGTASSPGNEDTPITPPLSRSPYGQSKAEAEALVLSYASAMEVVIVNPTFMVGRYGSGSGSNRVFDMARWLTICPSGGKNFIDVEDAAKGVIAALKRGKSGNRYLIAGENLTFKEFFMLFAKVKHVVVIPRLAMLFLGGLGSLLRMVGVKASLSLTNAQILCLPLAYDNTKARTQLGVEPKSLKQR